MSKGPQFAIESVWNMCKRPQKLFFASLKGRDKRQNENDFVISAERPSEIEKPERNCGLFHMEKEHKRINKWKRPQRRLQTGRFIKVVVKTTFLAS